MLRYFLERPKRVFLICLVGLIIGLFFNGGLWELLLINGQIEKLRTGLVTQKLRLSALDQKLDQARNPAFIEKIARENLELVDEGDLVFIFPKEQP